MSVYRPKAKDGSFRSPYWHYDFVLKVDGRSRRFHGSTGQDTKSAARKVEKRLRELAATGALVSTMTVSEACWRYWREVGRHKKSSAAIATNLEHLCRLLGADTLMRDLDAAAIATAAAMRAAEPRALKPRAAKPRCRRRLRPEASRARPVALSTVNRQVIEPMRRLWRRAVKVWRVPMGPEPEWSALLYQEPPGRTRTLTSDEEARFWAALRPDYVPIVWWLVARGFRFGECFIRRRDVDLGRGVAKVRISRKREGVHTIEMKLGPTERAVLDAEMKKAPSPFVFTYEVQKGKMKGHRRPVTYWGLQSYLRGVIARLGFEDFRIHDLRHDAATKALLKCQNLKKVQHFLRHSDISATARYAHVLDSDVAELVGEVAASRTIPETALPAPARRDAST